MTKPKLTLAEVYRECLEALRCRQYILENQILTLNSVGDSPTARDGIRELVSRAQAAEYEVERMCYCVDNELDKLRFERDQLLQELSKTSAPETPVDVAAGESSEPTVSPGVALAVAIKFLVDTAGDTRLPIKDRIAASRVLLNSQERLDA